MNDSYAPVYTSSWWGYIGKRLAWLVVAFFVISLLIFLPLQFATSPIDPLEIFIEEHSENLRHFFGPDISVMQIYTRWISSAIRGDFGEAWGEYPWLSDPFK